MNNDKLNNAKGPGGRVLMFQLTITSWKGGERDA